MRRTFIWAGPGKMVEKIEATLRRTQGVMPDIQPFQTVDGAAIGSRSDLRAYEKRTGLEQVGNDLVNGGRAGRDKVTRVVQEMPSARATVEEAMRRHS